MYKEDILHCLKRVDNILQSQVYLSGNGEVENLLAENITNVIYNNELNEDDTIYFDLVKEAYSLAFRDFAYLIKNNDMVVGNNIYEITSKTFDDFQSKIEAWRMACKINMFFLNCDMSIIY